ncbi:glycoside hydrolase family 43 protein [soil metagenome]
MADDTAYDGYFADPFVLRLDDGSYAAYGTNPAAGGDRVFEALWSPDLVRWESRGSVLGRLGTEYGDEYWAPEVMRRDGAYWLYYSVGRGIEGHHIRVARSDDPFGPFVDLDLNLTPDAPFAIDAHPFIDDDGTAYLFFARDVTDTARPGTQLAVAPLVTPTTLGPVTTALEPNADWQLYERDRPMYGATLAWHTIEGPSVVQRGGRYWMTYSGGAWTGDGYAVSWAAADSPLGPWQHAPADVPPVLSTVPGLIGPGHNSLVVAPDGHDAIAFHAWDDAHAARRMHVRRISFEPEGPRVDGPIRGSSTPPDVTTK